MLKFTKLHGNGNDFILIDEFRGEIIPENKKSEFAERYCDRRFGIGADGVIYITYSDKAEIKMRIFNSDGSEAEMCGNGIRCIAKYAFDRGYAKQKIKIETLAGVKDIEIRNSEKTYIKVNMGKPEILMLEKDLNGFKVSAADTGVPHAVIYVDKLDSSELMNIAPKIRYNPIFPNGANVNFVHIDSENEITIRTYERGVESETLSCGTGSVASAFISNKLGKTKSHVKVNTKGGELMITLKDDVAFMEGSAERVFDGDICECIYYLK